MKHIPEEELVAYQLGDSQDGDATRRHLEQCLECAAIAESIAETLRVFSAEPVPQANLDHAWQRMRGSLPAMPLGPKRSRSSLRLFAWSALGFAVALVVVYGGVSLHRGVDRRHATVAISRLGPLTEQPADPAISNHLDSAERLLTEVNHASGPMDQATRTQAHDLLLKNAVYVRKAHDSGDLAEASVLENLGRVLTTMDHEPARDSGWHIRFEMNTDGLLLDIRILRQNDARQ